MQVTGIRADDVLDVGQKGDHVVPRGRLDLLHPRGIDDRVDPTLDFAPDGAGGRHGHLGQLGHRVKDAKFDLEPEPQPVLRRPDRGHFGATVASEHDSACLAMDRPTL